MTLFSALLAVVLVSSFQTVSSEPGVDPVPLTPAEAEATAEVPPSVQSAGSSEVQAAPEEGVQASAEEGWRFLVTPYLFASGLDGTVRTGQTPLDIQAGFDDLFALLNFGGMLSFEARPPASKWTLMTDLVFVQLEQNGTSTGPLQTNVDTELDQFIGELSAAYEVMDEGRLEVLGGVRYWNIAGDLQLALPTPRSQSGSVDWIDPLLGVRSRLKLGSHFDLLLRGDLGGFGVGSDISYNLAAEVGWSISELLQLALGYRYLYVDYEDDVTYDMSQAGPVLGLSFRF